MVLAMILMLAGAFFLTVSCIGLLRLPDFYTRAHAVGKSETLGAILLLGGLAIFNGWTATTLKVLFILVFLVMTAPVAIHALSRSALITGLQPWVKQQEHSAQTPDSAALGTAGAADASEVGEASDVSAASQASGSSEAGADADQERWKEAGGQ